MTNKEIFEQKVVPAWSQEDAKSVFSSNKETDRLSRIHCLQNVLIAENVHRSLQLRLDCCPWIGTEYFDTRLP